MSSCNFATMGNYNLNSRGPGWVYDPESCQSDRMGYVPAASSLRYKFHSSNGDNNENTPYLCVKSVESFSAGPPSLRGAVRCTNCGSNPTGRYYYTSSSNTCK